MRMRHIVISGQRRSKLFFQLFTSNDTIFEKKKKKALNTKCVFFLYNFCLKHFSF